MNAHHIPRITGICFAHGRVMQARDAILAGHIKYEREVAPLDELNVKLNEDRKRLNQMEHVA